MILSNVELHKSLDEKRIIIDPEPFPRVPTIGQHCPYDTHSVDLTLAPEISVPKEKFPYAYDLSKRHNLSEFLAQNSDKYQLGPNSPYQLERNQFILAKTRERVELPLSNDPQVPSLAARIEGKSSRARLGLLVHFTAPTVHPGFEGTLTLEIINLGPAPILLHAGVAIAQLIIEEILGSPIANPSQFQGQSSPEGVVGE